MYLVITIDTEEDNWGDYNSVEYSLENVKRIPRLQDVFTNYGVRPTYLISYPVATDTVSVRILGGYRERGLCEIGTHPHTWNTPPIEEEIKPFNSFINNLDSSLQYRKIRSLHDAIVGNFSSVPTVYRSGRWGFSEEVARNLIRLGYKVDSSITPFSDWRIYQGPDYSGFSQQPYRYLFQDTRFSETMGTLLEVPATIGFLQSNQQLANAIYWKLNRGLIGGRKLLALLNRFGLLSQVNLSPETHDLRRMIFLSKRLLEQGTKVLNMFFHSPSLREGCSPFVKTISDLNDFIDRIDKYIVFAKSAGMKFVTLSELTKEDLNIVEEKTL